MIARLLKFSLVLVIVACGAYFAVGAYVRGSAPATLVKAAEYLQNSEPERARQTLGWLLWFEPRHAVALQLAGMCYVREQRLSEAIACLEQIESDAPVHAMAERDLIAALIADRQLERAETVARRHCERYPDSLVAVRMLSGLLLSQLRQREAIQVLEKMVEQTEFAQWPWSDQLLVLRDLSTAELHPPSAAECRTVLSAALERFPDQPLVKAALGLCILELDGATQAEPLLREAYDERPDAAFPRFALAACYLQLRSPERAASVLTADRMAALEKDDRYWDQLSRLAEQTGDHRMSLSHIDQALALQPANKSYLAQRARLLQLLSRSEEAQSTNARVHVLSRAELDLWNLSREFGTRTPTPADCERIADLYRTLEKPLQAAAWQRMGSLVDLTTTESE